MCCSPVSDRSSRIEPDPGSRASGAPRNATRGTGIPGTDPADAPAAPNKPNWAVPWRARETRNPKQIRNANDRNTRNAKQSRFRREARHCRLGIRGGARDVKRTQFRCLQGSERGCRWKMKPIWGREDGHWGFEDGGAWDVKRTQFRPGKSRAPPDSKAWRTRNAHRQGLWPWRCHPCAKQTQFHRFQG